jgi:hypothetical protein
VTARAPFTAVRLGIVLDFVGQAKRSVGEAPKGVSVLVIFDNSANPEAVGNVRKLALNARGTAHEPRGANMHFETGYVQDFSGVRYVKQPSETLGCLT